jgi:hypothetical protein
VPFAVLLLVIVVVALAAAGVVAMAYRRDTPRAWNAVAIFAVGMVIAAYGALIQMLEAHGADRQGQGPRVALAAGLAIAACGFLLGLRQRDR